VADGWLQVGELLRDRSRINVALTRARSKLVLLGCARTLKSSPVLAEVTELMQERGWIYELCPEEVGIKMEEELKVKEKEVHVEQAVQVKQEASTPNTRVKMETVSQNDIIVVDDDDEDVAIPAATNIKKEIVDVHLPRKNMDVIDLTDDW
jgi:hypothetical protein